MFCNHFTLNLFAIIRPITCLHTETGGLGLKFLGPSLFFCIKIGLLVFPPVSTLAESFSTARRSLCWSHFLEESKAWSRCSLPLKTNKSRSTRWSVESWLKSPTIGLHWWCASWTWTLLKSQCFGVLQGQDFKIWGSQIRSEGLK